MMSSATQMLQGNTFHNNCHKKLNLCTRHCGQVFHSKLSRSWFIHAMPY